MILNRNGIFGNMIEDFMLGYFFTFYGYCIDGFIYMFVLDKDIGI